MTVALSEFGYITDSGGVSVQLIPMASDSDIKNYSQSTTTFLLCSHEANPKLPQVSIVDHVHVMRGHVVERASGQLCLQFESIETINYKKKTFILG